MTVLEADVLDAGKEKGVNPVLQRSFGLMLEALDDLKEDEVYVCSGSSPAYALWGELMSARAIRCKAAGAVVNGYSVIRRGYWPSTSPASLTGLMRRIRRHVGR